MHLLETHNYLRIMYIHILIDNLPHSDCSSTFQVLLDFLCIVTIKALQFLVELHVAFIDEVDVCIIIIDTAARILLSFGYPEDKFQE